ncbi:MAG: RNA 2',3'-cyclic phosphodiesterase [Microthrixaceae bacterium]|nr:RNA 2',3'-cyclic phosphodiesterase [Microthrixaceae bacterium]
MSRLFLAVWPPPEIQAVLEELPKPTIPGLRWVDPTNWHVTLRFLGEADPDAVADRLERAELPKARAALGPKVAQLGRGHLVVPVGGLERLAASVRDATAGPARQPDGRPFTGHVTLARLKSGSIEIAALFEVAIAAGFDVCEVALVESFPLADGARYSTLRSWPTV